MTESNRNNKPRENQNAQRKGNLLGNTGSGHHQIMGDERKKIKEYIRRTRKLLEIKLHGRNLTKVINTWAICPPRKILGNILEVDQRKTSTSGLGNIGRLYGSRKVASIEDSVTPSIR